MNDMQATAAMERFHIAHPEVVFSEYTAGAFRLIAVINGDEYEGRGDTMEAAYTAAIESRLCTHDTAPESALTNEQRADDAVRSLVSYLQGMMG